MRKNKSLAAAFLAAAGIILGAACLYTDSPELFTNTISMVTTTPEVSAPAETPPVTSPPVTAKPTPKPGPSIIPTTISGGLVIKNSTDYSVQVSELIKQGSPVKLQRASRRYLLSTPIPARPTPLPDLTNMSAPARAVRRTTIIM